MRYQEALKDEPGCETLNDYMVSAIESATEGDERIHRLKVPLRPIADTAAGQADGCHSALRVKIRGQSVAADADRYSGPWASRRRESA